MSDIVSKIIAIEEGELGPLATLETFGELIKSGAISGLQGSWQRAVSEAVANGLITPEGDLTEDARATFGDVEDEEDWS
jgi:hypothetical protein